MSSIDNFEDLKLFLTKMGEEKLFYCILCFLKEIVDIENI